MSHELRTPLNAISGFAQLLFQSGDTLIHERQIRYAQNIMTGSEHLKKIVDDVLDMAGIEIGRVNVMCEVLDCTEVLSEVYRLMEGLAKERGIMFTADTSVTLPPVLADRGRLVQILTNLLSNAIKYNAKGGWVMLAGIPGDGVVRFSVSDNGRGVSAQHHGQVFEAFNRCGAETLQEPGTGLGLAISRQLVEAMRGEIGFESVAGAGSKFWVDLPVTTEIVSTEPQSQPSPSAVAVAIDYKILYIEDRHANVDLMRAIIEDVEGAQLFDAQTVEDGMTCMAAEKPDLVITDIHLPDGTGFDVIQRLRANPDTRHIPVIALTADAMPTNIHNMQRHRFDYILTKPFKISELTDIMRITRRAA
jgi:CheY-like chemotaxis protein